MCFCAAVQWGEDGRPFHYLFYTGKQSYYSLMHVSAVSLSVFLYLFAFLFIVCLSWTSCFCLSMSLTLCLSVCQFKKKLEISNRFYKPEAGKPTSVV